MRRRRITRNAMATMFADIPPKHRRRFFARLSELTAKQVEDLDADPDASPRSKLEGFKTAVATMQMLGQISHEAVQLEEGLARLLGANPERPTVTINIAPTASAAERLESDDDPEPGDE